MPILLKYEKAKHAVMKQREQIAAVILAGGRASRMKYQDKALCTLHGKPLIEYVISKARDQVGALAISVNHNSHLYEYLQLPLIPDHSNLYAGPLVGIYSAMRYFEANSHESGIKYLACFAADAPHFPPNVIDTLHQNLLSSGSQIALCVCNKQIQPLFSLWRLDTIKHIESALQRGLFGPKLLLQELSNVIVDIPFDEPGYFININSEASLAAAEKVIKAN